MSRILLNIEAENCNAWASDLVMGLPSPLSVSLYLRALLAENKSIGFGGLFRFAMGLRWVSYDRGRLSARPLPTYQQANNASKAGPLMDEDRFGLSVSLLIETTEIGESAEGLKRAATFLPFLGGNVRNVEAYEIGSDSREIRNAMRGAFIYIDETDTLDVLFDGNTDQALNAVAVANLDPELQRKIAPQLGLTPNMLDAVNGRMFYVMPLGYRRLSDFVYRDDARPIKREDGTLDRGLHAFVEAAHGFVRLLGPRRAFGETARPWWRVYPAQSLDDHIVYHLKGECHGS